MYWSKYNILFKSTKHSCFLLYNTLSGFFTEIDENTYKLLTEVKGNRRYDLLQSEDLTSLINNKVITQSDEDELSKLKMNILTNRYDSKKINLTIAPTRDCNFKCIYCFEKDRPSIYMNEETEKGIIKFVEAKNINTINVCWYGGEPLMAKENIRRLSKSFISLNKQYTASIVTNGYLLDSQFISELDDLKIKTIQITIDGNKHTHNSRRPHFNDQNSFEKIIEKIRLLTKLNKNIILSIRVNLDKNNMHEFIDVYRLLKNINPQIQIYPGFIHDISSACKSSSCMDSKDEKSKFFKMLYSQYGIYTPDMVPQIRRDSCMARNLNSFLIDPDGEIYKCWHHIGVTELSIGNILSNKISNTTVLARYMKTADSIDDPVCQKCISFPICGGGCPDMRLKKVKYKKNNNYCSIFKDDIHSFLDIKYAHLTQK